MAMQDNLEMNDACEKLRSRLKENENLLRKAKDLIQNLQADLQLTKMQKSAAPESALSVFNHSLGRRDTSAS